MTHLHNLSGGVLGGDSLALSVHVGVGATVQLTTTGATRIYRARENAAVATQNNQIHIEQNALLEYVPDPIIPFARSRFSQHTSIALSSGAGLFWWEILAPGREACGEIIPIRISGNKNGYSSAGRPIAVERIRIEPRKCMIFHSPARFGPYRYWATFCIA